MFELVREVDETIVLISAVIVTVSALILILRCGSARRNRLRSEKELGRLRADGA